MNAPLPSVAATARFAFDNSFARELPDLGVAVQPAPASAPRLLYFDAALADALGIDVSALDPAALAALFAGNALPPGAQPVAQAYAGHQFGGFSAQLGDGRAALIGEVVGRDGRRRDLALKGSGRTPWSRGGDGKAAVGPMLREVLIGEAMHALGIPTTRALAVVATGDSVHRDRTLPGAVLTRVAASHLRVGTFEYFAARDDLDRLRRLLDYTVARHDPALIGAPDRALGLLHAVAERQAALVAQWLNVGFIHGVMNTDNMALSGETIDYGPCAFMEAFDPATVFSSIDHAGRYAYANQPRIAQWNLARFAEALLPVIDADGEAAVQAATEVLNAFPARHAAHLLHGRRAKLGLAPAGDADTADDTALADDFLGLLHAQHVDFTRAWWHLADAAEGRAEPLREQFTDLAAIDAWLARWCARCAADDGGTTSTERAVARAARMRRTNPRVIARNHRVEEALTAASDHADLGPFEQLLDAVRRPFDVDPALDRYAEPAPVDVTARYRTFCGT